MLTRVLPALHTWDQQEEGHRVISLDSNPKSIRDGKNRGINGTGVSPTQDPGSQKRLVFPRGGGWIKYMNVCAVINCSILSS